MGSSQSHCKYGGDCQADQMKGSEFCGKHSCRRPNCYQIISSDQSTYCHSHTCSKKDCHEFTFATYCNNHQLSKQLIII